MQQKKTIICLSIIIVSLVLIIIGWNIVSIPKLSLIGNEEVTIPYGKVYTENGVIAVLNGKILPNKKIIISGDVDTSKIGKYIITYSATNKFNLRKRSIGRIINIIDKEVPTLILNGKDTIEIMQYSSYKDEGCKAIDNVDGDISNKIKVESNLDTKKPGTYELKYTVSDSSNNTTSIVRTIKVKQQVALTPTLPILMYHFFYNPSIGEKALNDWYVNTSSFEEQMRYLKTNNYYFPSWDEVADFIDKKKELPKKSVVITIDDGNISFFKDAYPILNKYNIKATAFIITSRTNKNYLSSYQSSNINYQSHSHNMHNLGCNGRAALLCSTYDEGYNDIKQSINILGFNEAFAYPFGANNKTTYQIIKDLGFKVAVTTNYRKATQNDDKLLLPRLKIERRTTMKTFIDYVN